jgi:glycerol-3-phosphate dehydrogenase
MQHDQRRHQPGQLAGPEQMLASGRTPTVCRLAVEERFHHEHAARRHARRHVVHPGPVKIIEQQNRIKSAEVGPRPLEIDGAGLDAHVPRVGQPLRGGQGRLVAIHQQHLRAEGRGGQGMTTVSTGQVEYAHAGVNPVRVPGEPGSGAGSGGDRGQRHVRSSRRATLEQLVAEPADLLVIGGGITGAAIARDAAMRGWRTVLVDRGDFGSGTSSRSSRLVHGGLRYLEQGRLGLVFESLRERRTLLRIAPHLVRPLDFVFPVHHGDRVPLWKLAAGVALYNLLAQFRNVGRHRILGKRAALELEPMLRERGLHGAVRYTDAQCDDARLVIATVRSAVEHGARVANHLKVRGLPRRDGRVCGAEVEDCLTGARGVIAARIVVNATGPWVDLLRRLEEPTAMPLLRPTKGVHVMVARERIGHHNAIAFLSPIDGRVMFVLPWGELSYIGTTDTDDGREPDRVRASGDDLVYLLRSANARFPGAHLTEDDVRVTWAGLRPLLAGSAGAAASAVSREHAIVEGPGGMVTVAGGKLTTCRSMAAEAVDRACARLGERRPRAATDTEPLPGGETAELEPFRRRGSELGLPAAVVDHLVRHYGAEAASLYNLGMADRSRFELIHPAHCAIEAEVLHAARRELAQTVEDVLVRRVHLFYETRDRGVRAAERVAELLGGEFGWSAEQVAQEARKYREFVAAEPRTV